MSALLTAKDRQMPEGAQVQKLVRIGKRAIGKAEHLETTMRDYYARCGTPLEQAQCAADASAARARAEQATAEILAICDASDSLDLRRKARLARAI